MLLLLFQFESGFHFKINKVIYVFYETQILKIVGIKCIENELIIYYWIQLLIKHIKKSIKKIGGFWCRECDELVSL